MPTSVSIVFVVVVIALSISVSHASTKLVTDDQIIDSGLLTEQIGTNRTIIVDIEGDGEFRSIQEAVNAVPDGNSEWVIIHIRKGTYREQVYIPKAKQFIFMRGNGRGRTRIVWDECSEDNTDSATLRIEASNFIAFGISVKNDANLGLPTDMQTDTQSVAVLVGGDKTAFYHCAFYSAHNTLFDYKGRHFYDNCYIQGNIDFIFGRARSIYHDCEIFVNSDERVEIGGSITAQNRETEEDKSGFIFIEGKVYGIGGVYLGRAKGAFSRVVFAKTYLSNTITPLGWTNWSYKGSVENLFQAEYNCHGPGAFSEKRVPWSRRLTKKEAAPFLTIDFIEGKEWLPAHRLQES